MEKTKQKQITDFLINNGVLIVILVLLSWIRKKSWNLLTK